MFICNLMLSLLNVIRRGAAAQCMTVNTAVLNSITNGATNNFHILDMVSKQSTASNSANAQQAILGRVNGERDVLTSDCLCLLLYIYILSEAITIHKINRISRYTYILLIPNLHFFQKVKFHNSISLRLRSDDYRLSCSVYKSRRLII